MYSIIRRPWFTSSTKVGAGRGGMDFITCKLKKIYECLLTTVIVTNSFDTQTDRIRVIRLSFQVSFSMHIFYTK